MCPKALIFLWVLLAAAGDSGDEDNFDYNEDFETVFGNEDEDIFSGDEMAAAPEQICITDRWEYLTLAFVL